MEKVRFFDIPYLLYHVDTFKIPQKKYKMKICVGFIPKFYDPVFICKTIGKPEVHLS